MMPPYYWNPYYYPTPYPPMNFIYDLFGLMLSTYYWKLYIEAFKLAMDAWSKGFQSMFTSLQPTTSATPP